MSINSNDLLVFVKKNLILTICIALSSVLLVTIYLRSGLTDELQAEVQQKSDEGKRYHANLANASQLTSELQTVIEANRIVRDRAVNPDDLARNLQYFYRIEAETGVSYTDLRQLGGAGSSASGAKRPASAYVSVPYTISVHGDFTKIINFLRNVEQGAHFYRLNGLVAAGKSSDITLSLNIDLFGQP